MIINYDYKSFIPKAKQARKQELINSSRLWGVDPQYRVHQYRKNMERMTRFENILQMAKYTEKKPPLIQGFPVQFGFMNLIKKKSLWG